MKKSKGLRTDLLEETLAAINKEYEDNPIRLGDTYERVWRIPTGSLQLNHILGGDPILGYGFPIGKHTRFFGRSYSGKTLSSLNIIREAQNIHITTNARLTKLAEQLHKAGRKSDSELVLTKRDDFLERFPDGMICVYYNIEKQYSKELAQKVGIDTSRLYVSEGTRIETIGAKLQALLGSAHMHVLDSASVAAPSKLLESDFTQELPAIKARVWGNTWDRVKEHFDIENNCIIQIDQTRTKMEKMGQVLRVTNEAAGGQQVGFAADLTLQFDKRSRLYYDDNDILVDDAAKAKAINTMSGDREPDGIETIVKVEKSRVCKPFTTARIRIDTEKGAEYDTTYELFMAALNFGVLHKSGAWYYLVDSETGEILDGKDGKEKTSWQGKAKVQNACANDEMLRQRILDKWFEEDKQLEVALDKAKEDMEANK